MKEHVRLDGLLFSSDAQVLRVMNPSGHDHRSGGRIRRKAEGEGRLSSRMLTSDAWIVIIRCRSGGRNLCNKYRNEIGEYCPCKSLLWRTRLFIGSS